MNEAALHELKAIGEQMAALRVRASELHRLGAVASVSDYAFQSATGEVRLSELFGEHTDLMVVHNMGRSCDYCSLWADGFSGLTNQLESRTAFVLVSPDPLPLLSETARLRGWTFKVVSSQGTSFFKDMGFEDAEGNPWPGVSTFSRESDGTVRRVASAPFGPGDDYCAIWHLFDLLDSGVNGWEPLQTVKS